MAFLQELHTGHFYSVPFENLDLRAGRPRGLDFDRCYSEIITHQRGGFCHETGILMGAIFKYFEIPFKIILASVTAPDRSPEIHLVFLVTIDSEEFLFDIGYGAMGPRTIIPLKDGYQNNHPANSSKIQINPRTKRWEVFAKESVDTSKEWTRIYDFVAHGRSLQDVQMANYWVTNSTDAALSKQTLISLPTLDGRISVKNSTVTKIAGEQTLKLSIEDFDWDDPDAAHIQHYKEYSI